MWLWWIAEPERLNRRAVRAIESPGARAFLSAASAWEVAIKVSLGKLELPEPPELFIPRRMARDRVEELPVTHRHALAIASLPPLHRDPFDRLLVAQARSERLTLVTADENVLRYGGRMLDARSVAGVRRRVKQARRS